MRFKRFPIWAHLVLLSIFCVGMIGIWLMPLFIAGFPYEISGFIPTIREFARTGLSPVGNGRIVVALWWLQSVFGWENILGWNAVSAAFFAAALFPWWWSVYRLFDARSAWLSTVILSLMPVFWIEAVRLSGYSMALFFLFLGFALFIELRSRNRLAAAAAFSICFGAVLVSRDAFQAFLPWLIVGYAWYERKKFKNMIFELGIACVLAYAVFTLPLVCNVVNSEGPLSERFAVLLPSLDRTMPATGHLYPDAYTYEFDRESFEELTRQRVEEASFLVQQEDANVRKMFGVSNWGFFEAITNSVWLFLNAIPSLFLMDTVGGVFLWLFILPGIGYVFTHNRKLFSMQLGLFLSMEFLFRFVLHYHRTHLMDFGWMLALFAGLGIVSVSTALAQSWKKVSVTTLSAIIVVLLAGQLLQANRKQFARMYAETDDYLAFAASAAVEALPDDSVVAYPRIPKLLYFTDRAHFILHDDTIDRLSGQGRLRDPFRHYGITHIIGYSDERAALIQDAVPGIQVVSFGEENPVVVTPFVRLLLHTIR